MRVVLIAALVTGCLSQPPFAGDDDGSGSGSGSGSPETSALAGGYDHVCAISAGQLRCWGANATRQLGVDAGDSGTPLVVRADLAWSEIAAGDGHACGIANDDKVYCWGDNSATQCGATAAPKWPVTAVTLPAGAGKPVRIFAGGTESCALDDQSQLICWGTLDGDQSSPLLLQPNGEATGWSSIALTTDHACALSLTGEVWCFGSNSVHQSNESSTTSADHFHWIEKSGTYLAIAVRGGSTCGVDTDNVLACWGGGGFDLFLGADPPIGGATNFTIDNTHAWTSVVLGAGHACGVAGNDVYCWGGDPFGATGQGLDIEQASLPQAPIFETSAPLVAGGSYTCGIDAATATVFCWGANLNGQLGNGEIAFTPKPEKIAVPTTATEIAVGRDHACAIADGGKIYCWGRDDRTLTFSAPILEPLPVPQSATAITAGNEQTCAISGTNQIACWGGDSESETPVTATGTAVSAGGFTLCATTGADMYNTTCWGPPPGTNANPVANGQLEMVNWRALAANDQLAIGLANTDQATVYEFGFDPAADAFAPLAPNANFSPFTTSISPTSAQLAVGNRHGCVLFEGVETELTCWGDNEAHESAPDSAPTIAATQVISPSGAWARTAQGKVLAASDLHTCAITSALDLVCWGSNESLALGDQPAVLATPTVIAHPANGSWLSVATGPRDTCAIDDTNAVYCWGFNEYGEAGNGARFHGEPVATVGP